MPNLPTNVAVNDTGHVSHTNQVHAFHNLENFSQNVRYVHKGGSDSNEGYSWGTAKATVAAAVKSLPIVDSGLSTQRHQGAVYIGPGTYTETDLPIPIHGGIQFFGVGHNFFNGTHIRRATAANAALFSWRETQGLTNESGNPPAWPADSTGYMHGVRFSNMILDGGSEQGNTSTVPLVRMVNCGYGTQFDGVLFRRSAGRGIYIQRTALTCKLFNTNFSRLDAGAIDLNMTANFTHFSIYGTEIDNCGVGNGVASILVRQTANPSAGLAFVNFFDLKFEGDSGFGAHDRCIEYQPFTTSGQGKTTFFYLAGVGAHNHDTCTALVYEANNAGVGGSFVFDSVAAGGAGFSGKHVFDSPKKSTNSGGLVVRRGDWG